MFRGFIRALGVTAVFWAIYRSVTIGNMVANNEVSVTVGIVAISLALFVSGGFGVMMIIFDPHKVFQLNIFALHQLVDQQRKPRSFADKIGANDDDEF